VTGHRAIGVKDRRNPIARVESRRTSARGEHDARAIGKRNPRKGRLPAADAIDHQQIPIVQRKGAELHPHTSGTGGGYSYVLARWGLPG
jgi:hypothetical protein